MTFYAPLNLQSAKITNFLVLQYVKYHHSLLLFNRSKVWAQFTQQILIK